VGASVRDSVGASVGDSVWDSVGDSVGASVGASVRDSVRASCYGQHDANWLGFYDYFFKELNLLNETKKLEGLWLISKNAGWFLPHEKICWISERHSRLERDDRGRLHSDNGMAFQYPDGWGAYYWHGVKVSDKIILKSSEITINEIEAESNQEVRRIMVERMGRQKFIKSIGGQKALVHEDSDKLNGQRALYHFKDMAFLEVADPSTGRIYYLDVPSDAKTCQEANDFLERDELGEAKGRLVAAS